MRRCLIALAMTLSGAAVAAQRLSLDDVVARLDTYLKQYEQSLASVVAEERYVQKLSRGVGSDGVAIQTRTLVSDYALARSPQAWTGFRDTWEVDGRPVRDREDRLAALLASGSPDSAAQAFRITRENARFNIGDEVATRTINVPTVTLDLVHPRHREHFSFNRRGEETIDGMRTWTIGFSERTRPTIIRGPGGRDQRARGTIWVNPDTGEVLRTNLLWDGEPKGFITVHYRRDPNVDGFVPATMIEQYQRSGMQVDGEATYTGYRRFQTSGRLIN